MGKDTKGIDTNAIRLLLKPSGFKRFISNGTGAMEDRIKAYEEYMSSGQYQKEKEDDFKSLFGIEDED